MNPSKIIDSIDSKVLEMNVDSSMYRKERELIKLQQLYNDQEQQVKNSAMLQKLGTIQESFQVFNDIAKTQISFCIDTDVDLPYYQIPRENAKDLVHFKDYIFSFCSETKDNDEVICSGVEENVTNSATSIRDNKELLHTYKLLRKNCNFLVGNSDKIQ
ncbi:hypothetical protein RN001_006955 [Aquatica leii]|uniref:Uncharacterized protein n=1 Tax=Aquatica leii TaxID=1421715 RepID=A0AAN7SBR9_9COLE|nr:hypothetical protein RN001_006955 [Aquatica leii]